MRIHSNINFHQTFKPERQYISAILEITDYSDDMDIKEISSITGIPTGKSSGKVEPHILYAQYMGLITAKKMNNKYHIELTKFGIIVKSEDPGLVENLTLLLCHCMIVRVNQGAELWSYVFNRILPSYRNVIKVALFNKELEQKFGTKIKLAPFNGTYTDFLKELNIIDVSDGIVKMNKVIYNKEHIYLYALVLFEYWDEIYNNQDEISSLEMTKIGFRNPFGWNEKEEYEILEHMSDKGILRFNRQLMPYTILRLLDKQVIIDRLYNELC
jgi:hypothetical protein